MNLKAEFIDIFEKYIKREGADELLNYLKESDFFTAPASTRFHLAEEGGLCLHSLNVYKRLVALCDAEYGVDRQKVYSDETLAICGLLHDLCKIDTYTVEYRNIKVNGSWESRPYYAIADKLPYGHGEKSVYIINGFIRLSREEAMAINWHMGAFDDRVKGGSYTIASAFEKYPLSVLLHTADFHAAYLDERNIKK